MLVYFFSQGKVYVFKSSHSKCEIHVILRSSLQYYTVNWTVRYINNSVFHAITVTVVVWYGRMGSPWCQIHRWNIIMTRFRWLTGQFNIEIQSQQKWWDTTLVCDVSTSYSRTPPVPPWNYDTPDRKQLAKTGQTHFLVRRVLQPERGVRGAVGDFSCEERVAREKPACGLNAHGNRGQR